MLFREQCIRDRKAEWCEEGIWNGGAPLYKVRGRVVGYIRYVVLLFQTYNFQRQTAEQG